MFEEKLNQQKTVVKSFAQVAGIVLLLSIIGAIWTGQITFHNQNDGENATTMSPDSTTSELDTKSPNDINGRSRLVVAILDKDAAKIGELVRSGEPVNSGHYKDEAEVMNTVALFGYAEGVKVLLDYGIEPTSEDLCSAVHSQNIDCIKVLLSAGVDPNMPGRFDSYALNRAAGGVYAEGIEVLLAAGANPNISNDRGDTPLHYVVEDIVSRIIYSVDSTHEFYKLEDRLERIEAALSSEYDYKTINRRLGNPVRGALYIAKAKQWSSPSEDPGELTTDDRRMAIVKRFIDVSELDVDENRQAYIDVILEAAKFLGRQHEACLRYLLDAGANPNIRNNNEPASRQVPGTDEQPVLNINDNELTRSKEMSDLITEMTREMTRERARTELKTRIAIMAMVKPLVATFGTNSSISSNNELTPLEYVKHFFKDLEQFAAVLEQPVAEQQ